MIEGRGKWERREYDREYGTLRQYLPSALYPGTSWFSYQELTRALP